MRFRPAFIVAVCTICLFPCCAKPPATAGRLQVQGDGGAYVQGAVAENNHSCDVDAVCFLRLLAGGQDVRVVYGIERGWNGCRLGKRVSDAAWPVKVGAVIEAFGRYQAPGEIQPCDPEGFISPLDAPGHRSRD